MQCKDNWGGGGGGGGCQRSCWTLYKTQTKEKKMLQAPGPESLPIELSTEMALGLDKICLAKFELNGQPKERSNSASKMGCQFCQKSKMGKE